MENHSNIFLITVELTVVDKILAKTKNKVIANETMAETIWLSVNEDTKRPTASSAQAIRKKPK